MANRELKRPQPAHYFKSSEEAKPDITDGTRDMFPLAPFVISGGRNTERYYFIHVNVLSAKYKFNIRPKYFGDESAYIEVFPMRIKEILSKNADAKVFCVFDMDTVVKYEQQAKHKAFVDSLSKEIESGQVVLCDSMPSFEFWLLLHFVDYEGLLKDYPEVSQVLAPYIKPYFEDSTKGLKKLLKSEKYLQDSAWVKRLLEEGRLGQAIERAKECIRRVASENGQQSYTNVFKAFE
jgi:hypothetical protein